MDRVTQLDVPAKGPKQLNRPCQCLSNAKHSQYLKHSISGKSAGLQALLIQIMDTLAQELQDLQIDEPTHLCFVPPVNPFEYQGPLPAVPRYMYRTVRPNTSGVTNEEWVTFLASWRGYQSATVDFCQRQDRAQAAEELNFHLWWKWYHEANLVSWTSSFLLALKYMFYLYETETLKGKQIDLSDIQIHVLDTKDLPTDVLIRDMDLIRPLRTFNTDLGRMWTLRQTQKTPFTGHYYFGEYLSQGSLNFARKCTAVTAKALVDRGLLTIRPELEQSWNPHKPGWANDVINLREPNYSPDTKFSVTKRQKEAMEDLSQLFESR